MEASKYIKTFNFDTYQNIELRYISEHWTSIPVYNIARVLPSILWHTCIYYADNEWKVWTCRISNSYRFYFPLSISYRTRFGYPSLLVWQKGVGRFRTCVLLRIGKQRRKHFHRWTWKIEHKIAPAWKTPPPSARRGWFAVSEKRTLLIAEITLPCETLRGVLGVGHFREKVSSVSLPATKSDLRTWKNAAHLGQMICTIGVIYYHFMI